MTVGNNRIVLPFSDYKEAGNQKKARGRTFVFDAENRQKQVTIDMLPGNVFTYSYDGDGRRVKRMVAGITRIYVYNGNGQMVAEYHSPNLAAASPRKEFIHLGGRLLATEMIIPPGTVPETRYVTADHLGSTRVVTDAAATVDSRHDYLPFGKEIPTDFGGRVAVAGYGAEERILQRFTGKELDPETGLEYFGARYYSGRQGRFTTPDKVFSDQDVADPQSWNLYGYVRNNPLRHVDPDGEDTLDVTAGFFEGTAKFVVNTVKGAAYVAYAATPVGVLTGATQQLGSETAHYIATGIGAYQENWGAGVVEGVLAQGEQGAMAIVTEAVLTGGATAAAYPGRGTVAPGAVATESGAAVTKPPLKPAPPGENAAAAIGRAADADFAAKVRSKPGWQSQPRIIGPDGKIVQPDAITKLGHPLERKPNTPSGRAAGRRQLRKYEVATGKKGRVIYYDPEKYKPEP